MNPIHLNSAGGEIVSLPKFQMERINWTPAVPSNRDCNCRKVLFENRKLPTSYLTDGRQLSFLFCAFFKNFLFFAGSRLKRIWSRDGHGRDVRWGKFLRRAIQSVINLGGINKQDIEITVHGQRALPHLYRTCPSSPPRLKPQSRLMFTEVEIC